MSKTTLLSADYAEIIEGAVFTIDELARLCGVTSDWVDTRIKEGILVADDCTGQWRFDSGTLIRARKIIHLEVVYDADPQLAALTADLLDEVVQLRQQLRCLNADNP